MPKKITVAIDGWSSCGKSTLARDLANELDYIYVDSGAMYRGVTYFALENGLINNEKVDEHKLIKNLNKISLVFQKNKNADSPELFLNGKNIEAKIRSGNVPKFVSEIAKIKEVREFLVKLQRKMGENGGVVMDGRDIGSVVFPNAELKLFITAEKEIRVNRRYQELKRKGENITIADVRENLAMRDKMDTERKESPLIQTEDAIVLDNSTLNQKEQLKLAMSYVKKILGII